MNELARGRAWFMLLGFLWVCASILAAPLAQAQTWQSTQGPSPGGIVRGSFVPNSGTGDYWAAIYGAGMYKSSDGGNTWVPNNGTQPNVLSSKRVYAMAVDAAVTPYRGYVGTLSGGVFKTDDGGANWVQKNSGLGCAFVRTLNVTFGTTSATDVVLAGTGCGANSGIYRSVDGGTTWTTASGIQSSDVMVHSINTVAPSGNTAINLRFAATTDGIYKSSDQGVSWTLSNGTGANMISGPNGPITYNVAFTYDATNGLTLIAAVEGGGLFKSTDQGANWTSVLAKPPIAGISTDVDKNFYAAIDGEGVYRSTDRGASWALFVGNAAMPPVRGVGRNSSVSNSPYFIANTMAGMYRSSDSGVTWSKMGSGWPDGYSVNVQADFRNTNGDVYAAAADGVYICAGALSPTGNCSWTKIGGGNLGHLGAGGHALITAAGIYTTTTNLGVFKFDETNKVWVAMNNGLPNTAQQGGQLRGDPNSANGLWLGLATRGMYYSADAGATWVAKNGTTLVGAAMNVRHIAVTPTTVLISTDAGLYKSTDSGASWNKLPFPAVSTTTPSYELPADHIAIDGATGNMYVAVLQTDALGAPYPGSGVWKSTDGGTTWTQSLSGRKVHEIRVARDATSMTLYAGIWEPAPTGGAWQSTDDGTTWTQISTGLTNNLISSFGVVNGVLKGVATLGQGVQAFTPAATAPATTNPTGANYNQVFIGRNLNLPGTMENFGVSVAYPRAANDQMKSAVLACPGASSTHTFSSSTTGIEWGAPANLGNMQPPTPFNCYSTVTYTDNTVNTQTVTVDRFSPANYYVTNISLQPNANLTTAPSVTWSPPTGTAPALGFNYQSNVFTSNFGSQLWYSGHTMATQVTYNGPALTPNAQYIMGVTTIEGAGTNIMHAAQTWIPFCFQCTTGGTGGTTNGAGYSDWKFAGVVQDSGQTFYGVSYGANDPQQLLASVSISGSGQTVNAIYWQSDKSWHADMNFGATQPSLANVYTGTYTPKSGAASTVTFQIDKFITSFPTNLQPSGGQNVATTPSFSWTPPTGTFQYGINLAPAAAGGGGGAIIWSSYNVTSNPVIYNGPPLVPGTMYKYWVGAFQFDSTTQINHGASRTETFCFQCTTGGTGGTTTGGTATVNFVAGWNLVGNGLSTALTAATAFGDQTQVTTVWKWVPASSNWAFYTPTLSDGGAAYAASKGYAFLTTINGGEGFWVNAKSAFSVALSGNPVPTSNFADGLTANLLPTGWSLIAIGDNKAPGDFATSIAVTPPTTGKVAESITSLWAWNPASSAWYFYAPSLVNAGTQASYISSKGYLDFATVSKTLDPTTGFWVNHP